MHHYAFHIGDYASHTRHLSLLEDLAYRRLLDLYYLREEPPPANAVEAARLIGMPSNLTEVEQVLREFFYEDGPHHRHRRVEEEIAAYQAKIGVRSKAGKASGEARSKRRTHVQHMLNGRSTGVHNREPEPRTSAVNQPAASGDPCTSTHSSRCTGNGQQDESSADGGTQSSRRALLWNWLHGSHYRRNGVHREKDILDAVVRLDEAGITPADLDSLAAKARVRAKKSWHGMLARWIDNVGEALKELGKR